MRRQDVLLVDGYNMIGAWPELDRLKEEGLEEARDRLLTMLADYQGFTGMQVIVIFDAHRVPGHGATYKQYKLTVIYTREKETADEVVERLVGELKQRGREIYVATSDMAEQHMAFGKGALRLSARELLIELGQSRKELEQTLKSGETASAKRNPLDDVLSLDVRTRLERLRRGDKS
ncbi:NYN domain-containing protein [Paenibacillus daejeonensis]|uniref:NYN domain-containing protein n=1 Tax=Paenibacillus daejeonensis TaxID=135193 RepID=UPI00037544A7|nr:NYN domain-containing protein [Paenibacillus daejeonensis]